MKSKRARFVAVYDPAAAIVSPNPGVPGAVALAILLALPLTGHAASPAERPLLSEAEFFGEMPVVLSASRLAQPLAEAPASVTVIDRAMIRAAGVRELADIFRLVPGFQVANAVGGWPVVTYHGLSDQYARRMQVLIDGRSVFLPSTSGVFWSDLPLALDDIERVEVVRGPNAAVYGTNAFLATINIITRHAAEDRGTFLRAVAGSEGMREAFVRYGGRVGELDYRVTLGHRGSNGFRYWPDATRIPLATLRADYRLNPRDALEFHAGYAGGYHEAGEYGDPDETPHKNYLDNNYQHLVWRRAFAPGEELLLQYSRSYRRADENYVTDPLKIPPFGVIRVPVDFSIWDERHDLELQHTLQLNPRWRLVWGAGARRDASGSVTMYGSNAPVSNTLYRLLGNLEWRATDDFIVNAGAMLERSGNVGTDISPRVAVNYRVAPGHVLRAGVSRGTRNPNLLEENANWGTPYNGILIDQIWIGNRDINPERIRAVELGYVGELSPLHLAWDVRLFHERTRDLTGTSFVPYPDLYDKRAEIIYNRAAADVKGGEFQLRYRPGPHTLVALSHAEMRADASSDSASIQSGTAASVPRRTTSLLAAHRFPENIEGSLALYRVNQMRWLGNGDLVPGYTRLDLRLAKLLRFGNARSEVALVLQNLENQPYEDFRRENLFERRYFVTVSVQFP